MNRPHAQLPVLLASSPLPTTTPTLQAFPKLPEDIRLMVWKVALADISPRVVQVFLLKNKNYKAIDSLDLRHQRKVKYLATGPQSLPLLHVCRESRDVVQESPAFKSLLEERNTVARRLWINPNIDTVYMEGPQFLEFCYRSEASGGPIDGFEDIRHLALGQAPKGFESTMGELQRLLDSLPKLETFTLIVHGGSCDRSGGTQRYYWNRRLTFINPDAVMRANPAWAPGLNLLSRTQSQIRYRQEICPDFMRGVQVRTMMLCVEGMRCCSLHDPTLIQGYKREWKEKPKARKGRSRRGRRMEV